jgi:hypothetical protein
VASGQPLDALAVSRGLDLVGAGERHGVNADMLTDDKLHPSQADAVAGQQCFCNLSAAIRSTSNGSVPSNTWPTSPSAQDTVTGIPVFDRLLKLPVPTTTGTPSSRAIMAA